MRVKPGVNDARTEIPTYSDAVSSVQAVNKLPKEFDRLPLIPMVMFKLEMGKEMIGFAKVNFRE